ncbi:MAG: D-arabinono-1,4-lactone oxidase, partial [Acidimicrobiales bacterium]
RGLLDAGDHAEVAALFGRHARDPLAPPRPSPVRLPPVVPSGLVNPLTIAAFNEAWFRKSRPRQGHLRHLAGFFHPLDAVANWNHVYGRRGFVQYQYVVADEHRDLIGASIEHLQRAGAPVSLSVLKRFGPADPGPLSFPAPGWTLALDLPVGPPGVPAALRRLDEMVAAAGGRVYLAKDARMDRDVFARMYPRLDEFEAIRAKLDPDGVLQSDLARRLGLCEEAR